MSRWPVVLGLLLATAALTAAPPKVKIESPPGGWTVERRIKIHGTVSDTALPLAWMVVNGTDFPIRLVNGVFDQNVILANGENQVAVIARNREGEGRDTLVFHARLAKSDLQILLTFPPQSFYVDLWILQPDGQKCYWADRETRAGGVLHDLYLDAPGGGVGMGPQAYTIADAPAGEYLIQVNYWAGGQWGAGETAGGPYGGKARTPIVPLRTDVILFEGTEREQRLTYRSVLKKPGDTFTIGRVSIAPARTGKDDENPVQETLKNEQAK